ncbi:histidine kinase N-terminal 7TM domain-containing diguanylate cyclase [Salipaludibacillus daqingensis]|uniref:histidine kinase N-terminal 7TM domain-containing diguanylate cyclase n=1 Tax=Salipaludibacillus daqingensis TaxID=3041001 RepID=UPI002476E94B|nr:diguanylate cyclase [Salipaludibacillus daqingensis]
MREVLLPIIIYILPLFILFHMAVDVFQRNPKRTENRLLAIYFVCYGMLFLEEYIRQLVPIEYSPALVTYWFGNAGILIPSLFFHFTFKLAGFDKKMPKYLYPYIFYVTLIPILLTFIFRENIMNSQDFVQVGMWIYPEFNSAYIMTLTIANFFSAFIIGFMVYLHRRSASEAKKQMFTLLIIVAFIAFIWNIIFGYFEFRGVMPPYPYIFAGLFWAVALGYATRKFDFLASYNKRFATLYNLNPASIILVNKDGIIESSNPAAKNLLHVDSLSNQSFHQFFPDKKKQTWLDHFKRHFSENEKFYEFETKLQTRDGIEKYVLIDGDYVFIDQEPHNMLIIRDVDENKEAENTIRFLAYHDALTKLPNRRYFYEQAPLVISKQHPLAIVVIDLDGFKLINDTYGHQTGDHYLIHTAKLLEHSIKNSGMASRVGGDEFYMYFSYETQPEVIAFATNLLDLCKKQPFQENDVSIPIHISMGISLSPNHGNDLETLIHKADQAMYQMKHNGKNGYHIYSKNS